VIGQIGAANLTVLTVLLFAASVFGQVEEKEPKAVVEIGGAGEWALNHGTPSYGPNAAVEVTPIKEWLEIEAGVTPFFSRGQREWDTDLLFKKPYTLSRTAEFMCGIGPEWAHATAGGRSTNSIGAEGALDFMFWPWKSRRFGWYLEPSYGYSFAGGHEQSGSVTIGLLIAIR
jgi:hypothetical protein